MKLITFLTLILLCVSCSNTCKRPLDDNFSVSWNNYTEEEWVNSVKNKLFKSPRKYMRSTNEKCFVDLYVRADGCVTDVDMSECSNIAFYSNKIEEWVVFSSPFLPPPNEEKYISEPLKVKLHFIRDCKNGDCGRKSLEPFTQ